MLLGLPFLLFPVYHFWVPYMFNCCSFWHNGATYKAGVKPLSVSKGLSAFTQEYGESINLLPTIHAKDPVFVDLTNIILTVAVVLAYAFSLMAFIWPRWD